VGAAGRVVREVDSIRMEQDGITCKLFLMPRDEEIEQLLTGSWGVEPDLERAARTALSVPCFAPNTVTVAEALVVPKRSKVYATRTVHCEAQR